MTNIKITGGFFIVLRYDRLIPVNTFNTSYMNLITETLNMKGK
nr:MAG TPA: hypothetical protein [Bacteriophage sp.]